MCRSAKDWSEVDNKKRVLARQYRPDEKFSHKGGTLEIALFKDYTFVHGHVFNNWRGRRINIVRNPRNAFSSWLRWDDQLTAKRLLEKGKQWPPFVEGYLLMLDHIDGEPCLRFENPDKTIIERYLDCKIEDDWHGQGYTWNETPTNWQEHWTPEIETLWDKHGGPALEKRVSEFDTAK